MVVPAVAAAPGPELVLPRPADMATLLGMKATPGSGSPNWFCPGTSGAEFALCWERPGHLSLSSKEGVGKSGLGPNPGTPEGEEGGRSGQAGLCAWSLRGTIVESALPCCLLFVTL